MNPTSPCYIGLVSFFFFFFFSFDFFFFLSSLPILFLRLLLSPVLKTGTELLVSSICHIAVFFIYTEMHKPVVAIVIHFQVHTSRIGTCLGVSHNFSPSPFLFSNANCSGRDGLRVWWPNSFFSRVYCRGDKIFTLLRLPKNDPLRKHGLVYM